MKLHHSLAIAFAAASFACSSGPAVKTQAFAKLKNERTFEFEMPVVWKGVETAMGNYKILERDPEAVEQNEWNEIKRRRIRTDWIYSQSRDKYVEYKVNDSPRKKYLQMRVKYDVVADRVMGGTHVRVAATEEVERLNGDGSSAGYDTMDADNGRESELLDKINGAILSAPPI